MRFCLNSIRKLIIRVTSSKRYQNVRSDQTILGPFANVTLTLCVSWGTVVVYEKKNRSLVFSGSRKIPTLGSTVQWETRQASFPTGTVGPRVGIFLSPLNTNDGFYLSHTPVPALRKDKKRLAACRPHAGRTSIRDVIVIIK